MSKIRSLLILLTLCLAAAAGWLTYDSKSGATSLDGPNLSVREDVLGSQWVVRDEHIAANSCSAIEGEVTPGLRKLVRFTVMTPNTGNQDIFVGDPNVHFAANDGLFELATCHNHFHFNHYALYELVSASTAFPLAQENSVIAERLVFPATRASRPVGPTLTGLHSPGNTLY